MADTILGLPSYSEYKSRDLTRDSFRRQSLLRIPRGNAPLSAIFSMMKTEPINSATHTWFEKIYVPPVLKFRGTNPITSTAPTDGDADAGTNMTTGVKTTTTTHYIKVDTTERLALNSIIRLTSNGALFHITGITRGVADPNVNGYITCLPVRLYTAAATDDDSSGQIDVVGNSHGEASLRASTSGRRVPYDLMNQTYIAKTAMEFSGTQIKTSLEFDRTGDYKEEARDKLLDHFVDIENQIIFGKRATITRNNPALGRDEEFRFMSGIIEYLELWDAGSTGLPINGSVYAPFNMFAPATLDSDPRKRVIENADGTLTRAKMNDWFEKITKFATAKSQEKMILCGNGVLKALDQLVNREGSYQLIKGETAYGFSINTLHTIFGQFHLVTHPLFNIHPVFTNWMLILDVHSMCYKPVRGRDTELQVDIVQNGQDLRVDQYLTEGTLEMLHAPNNMLIKNVVNYSAS